MIIEQLPLLLYLAQKTKLSSECVISTTQLGDEFGYSQQTASRKIKELEDQELITKRLVSEGMSIVLTTKAQKIIEQEYLKLKPLFENTTKKLTGMVASGLGEGRYYVQIEGYQKAFQEKLNLKPFAGTLNLKVDPQQAKEFLHSREQITIEGFATKERTFGAILCYPVSINKKINGFIIKPLRSTHPDKVIEIIAPVYLRGEFNLEDGGKVTLE